MNIVQMILKLLTSGDNLSKIASALGINQEQAAKAVSAAVPTLLAALTGAASKPGGGADLANVLAKQDDGVLDNLSSLFSGGGAAAASKGSNILGSLLGGLGGGALGQIGSVLSRFTGVNEGAINKLLGLLVPLVLGALKKQSKGQDAAGIASMLAEQKGNIASALPSGLGSLLSSAVPGLSSVLGEASSAASSAARAATTEVRGAAREAQAAGSSVMKWLIPLLLLVLAFFLLPMMCRKAPETAPVVKEKPAEAIPAQDVGTKLISDATGLIKDATDSVASIKDEASATAALPKLQDITTKLGELQSQWAKLPQPLQKTVSDALRPLIAKLREAAQPVLALPVVGAKVKPIVDEMLGQLDKLIGATAAAAATAAKQTAGDTANAASEAASKAAETATAAATTAKQTAGDAADAVASNATETATAAATTAKQTAGDAAGAASEAASKAAETATAAATTAKQTAGDAAGAASEAASKAAEAATAAATTAKQTAGDAAGEATRDAGSAVADTTSQAGRAAGAAAGATLDFARKLNSGYELKGVNEGIERQLIEFAESAKPTGEAAWFNFDRLTFETDSATIRMSESREQLQNIVEILKAYRTMRIKIGGYTDNTGDEAHNVQLSKARAEATQKALVSMGIDASRIDVEGYGSQHPVASNDTEEGRARNRRVAVSVLQR